MMYVLETKEIRRCVQEFGRNICTSENKYETGYATFRFDTSVSSICGSKYSAPCIFPSMCNNYHVYIIVEKVRMNAFLIHIKDV